ncbi:hypothetical protein MRB53_042111 [Persea americana]|nr:hypothetical protein MRB53_042111 [Persea americana]
MCGRSRATSQSSSVLKTGAVAIDRPKAGTMENGSKDASDPAAFLGEITGAPVTVKLNSGVVYKGELQSVDGYMNIALEQTKEHVNGRVKRNYGDAFIRGNNGGSSLFVGLSSVS